MGLLSRGLRKVGHAWLPLPGIAAVAKRYDFVFYLGGPTQTAIFSSVMKMNGILRCIAAKVDKFGLWKHFQSTSMHYKRQIKE